MRKTNYSFQKRQRDLAKQQKRDAKRDKKLKRDGEPSVESGEQDATAVTTDTPRLD